MSDIEKCLGCNALDEKLNQGICSKCEELLAHIGTQPEMIDRLRCIAEARHRNKVGHEAQEENDLPEVLDAVRYRTCDREQNTWYVSVSELSGSPIEIFASTAFDNDRHLQSRISNLTTITRLISLILRNVFMAEPLTLEKTLTQLHRSSRQANDLPEMLSGVLANYQDKKKTGESISKEE